MSAWMIWIGGWAAMAVVMVFLWFVQRKTGEAGIVDVIWAAGVGLLSVVFAALADGLPERRVVIGLLAAAWALRLAGHLLVRVMRMPEDGRYQKMRQEWGDSAQRRFFWFFQVQAFWSALFAAPMLLAARNLTPLGLWDLAGLGVWVLAVTGEMIADRQLQRFRNSSTHRGQVCREGLWRYSRHPNYFFEWIHWWVYVLMGWQAPYGWLTLMGPATMLLFLLRITGIPATEANALRSRGDAYREYQRTTSAFFPWPPKERTT